ncbi:MAG TPA: serine protease [Polyangiaceae bacterium]|nr:serine protease [Polyangiaceae bacterium]
MDLRTLLFLSLAVAGCAAPARSSAPKSEPKRELARTELSRLSHSTVTLLVLTEGLWGTAVTTRESSGSGFVMEHEGARVVVTAAHVVRGATEIVVVDDQGRSAQATELLAMDVKADVAVLRVPTLAAAIPAIPAGDTPAVGEEVMLVSSPLGLSTTVAFGTVSAHRPEVRAVQLAAGVSPGSSGGLVADRRGRVIGVIRSKAPVELGGENIALATPIAFVADSLSDKHPLSLSARPDRRKMRPLSKHELVATPTANPQARYPGQASVVVAVGDKPLEHVCARANDEEAFLAIREANESNPQSWREGVGGSCATVSGGQKVEVWIGTKNVGRPVELTISRQK